MFIGIGLNVVRAGSVFSPASIFANGQTGLWYDPSDISTMFQDTAGTVRVTAPGQSVARINDKSGNGFHATQATLAKCPIYTIDSNGYPCLKFDGLLSTMVTASMDLTLKNKVTSVSGVYKASDVLGTRVFTSGPNNTTPKQITVGAPGSANGHTETASIVDSSGTIRAITQSGFTAPIKLVGSAQWDLTASPYVSLVTNQNSAVTYTTDPLLSGFLNSPIYLGSNSAGTSNMNGNIYGLILCASGIDASTISNLQSWMNGKTGAY